jgi:nicotinamidase/pyrazinamidase
MMPDFLSRWGIEKVYIAGLALDYCVKFTALDIATKLNIDTTILIDATRAVAPDTREEAIKLLTESGVHFAKSTEISTSKFL